VTLTSDGILHGVVIWVDYHLDSQISVITQPVPGNGAFFLFVAPFFSLFSFIFF